MMLTALLLATAALLHPVHETVSEVEWNPQSKRLEVAMRLDILDEQWIAKSLEVSPDSQWQGRYLSKNLFFDPVADPKDPETLKGLPIKWIGRKQQRGYVWWFFEVAGDEGQPPTSVQSKMLFDRHNDYQHRMIVLSKKKTGKDRPKAIELSRQQPKAILKL